MASKDQQPVTVWTIAGGILLALLLLRAFETWQQRRALAQFNEQMTRILQPAGAANRTKRQPRHATTPRPSYQQLPGQIDTTPLRDGERCINRQRFRRIENGWDQIGTCR